MTRPQNKTIEKKYLEYITDSIQSRKMRKSSLNYFFEEKYFGYQGHIFEITTQILMDYHSYLKNLQNLSLNTKINKWTILSSFLNWVMEYYHETGFMIKIPSKTVNWNGNHKRPETNKNVIIEFEEIEKLMAYFKHGNYKHYVMFRLFLETGMRKGELRKAKFKDVKIKKRHLLVYGKTGMKYYVFSNSFVPLLKIYVDSRRKLDANYEELFLTKTFKPYGLRTFNMILNYACNKLGIESNITTHTFRRSINTHRKRLKKCPNNIAKRLIGHKLNDVNEASYTVYDFKDLVELYDQYNPYEELTI